eukprot:4897820-Karenia_brevis.AAC.1
MMMMMMMMMTTTIQPQGRSRALNRRGGQGALHHSALGASASPDAGAGATKQKWPRDGQMLIYDDDE